MGTTSPTAKHISFQKTTYHWDFIVDFVCLEQSLIIEVDGGYHSEPQQIEDDLFRTEKLNKYGFTVLRFKNEQITDNIDEVMKEIKNTLYNE